MENVGRSSLPHVDQSCGMVKAKSKIKVNSVYLRNIQLQRPYKNNDLTAIHVIKRSLDYGQRWQVLNPILNNKHQVIKIHMRHKLGDLTVFYNEMGSRGIHNFGCLEIRIILFLLANGTSS